MSPEQLRQLALAAEQRSVFVTELAGRVALILPPYETEEDKGRAVVRILRALADAGIT